VAVGRGIGSEGYLDEEWLGEAGDQDLTGATRGKPARPSRSPREAGVEYMGDMGEELENQTLDAWTGTLYSCYLYNFYIILDINANNIL